MVKFFSILAFVLLTISAQAADVAAPTPAQMPPEQPPLSLPTTTITPSPTAATPPKLPPAAVPAPIQKLKSISDVTEDQRLPDVKVEAVQPAPVFDKSPMFNDAHLKAYQDLYNAYQEKLKSHTKASDDKVGDLVKPTDDKPKAPPGGVYLNSILYRANYDSVAWINGIKFKVNAVADDIKLISLNQNEATIMWRTGNYEVDLKTWADMFPSSSEASPDLSKLPPSRQHIKVDLTNKAIIFTLRPNQSLDIAGMAVKEGKIAAAPIADKKDADKSLIKAPLGDLDKMLQKAKEAVADEVPKKPVMPGIVPPLDPSGEKTAVFHRSIDNHFNIVAKLNDHDLTFKYDTGATITAVSNDDAIKLGIDVTKLDYKYEVTIADGNKVKAAEANIDNFTVGQIELHNVNILIAQGTMAQPLLGMSFISKLKKAVEEGDTLTLYQ